MEKSLYCCKGGRLRNDGCGEICFVICLAASVQAYGNVVRRMLEAHGRGMWNASEDKLDQLRAALNDIEDELEGVK